MLSVVTWLWNQSGYRSKFTTEHVNVLRSMVSRHYSDPFKFLCVTDTPSGLDPRIAPIPDWKDFVTVASPYGAHQPSCYRRLRLFHPEIGKVFGPRFVSLDLDTVIVGDLRPLWNRPEDFVAWGETNPKSFYNGSMVLLRAGSRVKAWDTFDPKTSPLIAKNAGKFGSDQGWLSYCLGKGEATWTREDGVYSYNVHLRGKPPVTTPKLPANARIVMFHGSRDPWSPEIQAIPWAKEHWC